VQCSTFLFPKEKWRKEKRRQDSQVGKFSARRLKFIGLRQAGINFLTLAHFNFNNLLRNGGIIF